MQWTEREKKLGFLLVVFFLATISMLLYILIGEKEEVSLPLDVVQPATSHAEETLTQGPEKPIADSSGQGIAQQVQIMVDVKGAVQQPGVYPLVQGARIYEVLEMAGGPTPDADTDQINLAQTLTDGVAVRVPFKGEDPMLAAQSMTGMLHDLPAGGDGKVNINTASESELVALPGIGPSKASAIIKYREENGPFQTIEELTSVSGIGQQTLENVRDQITVP